MSKQSQIIQDLANVYDITTRSLISCTFEVVNDITDPKVLKRYKEHIVFAIINGCDNALTNHSVLGNNDVYNLLRFMQGLVKPSEKLTTANFYNDNDDEMKKAINEGVNRILTEIINDRDDFTEKQKKIMLDALAE